MSALFQVVLAECCKVSARMICSNLVHDLMAYPVEF